MSDTTAGPILSIGIGAALAIGLSGAGTAVAAPSAALFAMRHHRDQSWLVAWAPMIISGVLSIYGLIIGVILAMKTLQVSDNPDDAAYLDQEMGNRMLAAGLAVGLACLASGAGMGAFIHRVGAEVTVSHNMTNNPDKEQPLIETSRSAKPTIPAKALLLNLVFMEAIGLYGLIIALFLSAP